MTHLSNALKILGAALRGMSPFRREPRADYRSAFAVSEAALSALKETPVENLSPRQACQELTSYKGPITDAPHLLMERCECVKKVVLGGIAILSQAQLERTYEAEYMPSDGLARFKDEGRRAKFYPLEEP